MSLDPTKLDKYLYIRRTPTWRIRALYSAGILTWLLVMCGYAYAVAAEPFYKFFVAPLLGFISVYYLSSYLLNLFYKQPSLALHVAQQDSYWQKHEEPAIDVFLPICGEDIVILENTWKHVARLDYQNYRVYVLDDSKEGGQAHAALARSFGFTYLSRENKGEMKKAGNLLFGFRQTGGEFIAIFDADFAPHPDFLKELLPYTADPKVGIVQSPQYFEATKEVHRRSPLEYGAAYVQEDFYRIIQVARDRLGGALCCGSNALYRRAALDAIGGPLQVRYSEDSRTGIALVNEGWTVRYVPIILALGLCPSDPYAYFHQQHRWCSGSMELLTTGKEFWAARMPLKARICYVSGFLYYLHHPLALLLTFQLFYALFFFNDEILLAGLWPFLPYIVYSFILLPLNHISRLRRGSFLTSTLQFYAYTHAVTIVVLLRRSVGWIPANAKQALYSRAYVQATLTVAAYLLLNLDLVALASRLHLIHIFNYNYYSVQFWIFWDIAFTSVLLFQMFKIMKRMQQERIVVGEGGHSLKAWELQTAGMFLLVLLGSFFVILYV